MTPPDAGPRRAPPARPGRDRDRLLGMVSSTPTSSSGPTTWARSTACRAAPSRPACEDFLDRIVHPDDRDAMRRSSRQALEHGTPYEFDLRVVAARQAACAGCTPARARSAATDGRTERITGLLSDVTERRQREEAHAFLDAASQVLAASMDPVQTLEEVAQLAVPRSRTGARSSSRRRPALRAGRRRPRRPREGPLGARAAGPLPARPRLADRRARRDPLRPLRALPGDRHARCWRPPRSTRSRSSSCASCRCTR